MPMTINIDELIRNTLEISTYTLGTLKQVSVFHAALSMPSQTFPH